MRDMIFYRSELIEFVLITDKILRFEEHCHVSDIVLTAVLRGSAELCLNGKTVAVTSGDVFAVLPYENHSLISSQPADTLTVCIKKQLAEAPFKCFMTVLFAAVNGMTDKGIDAQSAKDLLREAEKAYTAYKGRGDTSQDAMLISERTLIEQHPESEDCLDTTSRKVYMSKFHFIRRFRDISGLTPHRFRIQNRIRKAQGYLASGTAIADAALMSGFYDQSHFDRYFKKIVGISPKDYVDSVRNFLQE